MVFFLVDQRGKLPRYFGSNTIIYDLPLIQSIHSFSISRILCDAFVKEPLPLICDCLKATAIRLDQSGNERL